jgi:uncharacterized phiE125 gp8 family phage protein
MKYRLATPPSIEPVTLTEAINHLRVPQYEFDTEINAMIVATRQYVENYLNQSLISQTWIKFLDKWPSNGIIKLHKGPVISVQNINYLDTDQENQVLDETAYTTDIISQPALIKVNEMPELSNDYNPIMIHFTAGYGSRVTDIPKSLKHAILLLLGHFFENRGDEGIKTPPPAFFHLLNQKRIKSY